MITGRRQGNVVTLFVSVSDGKPYDISSFEDCGPADAFPMTMSYPEACAKYGKGNLQLFQEERKSRPVAIGPIASDADVAAFMRENKDESTTTVQMPVTALTKALPQPEQIPGFIDTKFVDDCVKRAIQNEIETYELAQKYASGKKAKEILIIIKALNDFMDRIENGKKD